MVIGENRTFKGPESYSGKQGVKLVNLDLEECKDLMREFIKKNPRLWDEDIGE